MDTTSFGRLRIPLDHALKMACFFILRPGPEGWTPSPGITTLGNYVKQSQKIAQITLSATAILFTTIALWFLLGVTGRVKKKGSPRTEQSIPSDTYSLRASTGDPVSTRPREDLSPLSLADLLREDLDPDLPVSTGNGKADDPLIITEMRDYVGVEYAIADHTLAMMNEEYKLKEQRVHRRGDRVIDELVFDVKPSGTVEWTGLRRFFFDITAGFSAS